jgi:hypothetical protein
VGDALRPLLFQRAIRKDLQRYRRAVDKGEMLEAAKKLAAFDRPTLVVWSPEVFAALIRDSSQEMRPEGGSNASAKSNLVRLWWCTHAAGSSYGRCFW